jgi:uracil-DNA glycosylase family 4
MSQDDARRELADIARGLRRTLERDAWNGHAELLATAARHARIEPPAPAPALAPTPALATAPAAATSRAPARAAAPVVARDGDDVPLNPRDPAERMRIAAASKPVLEAIAREIEGCTQCELHRTRTRAVPGVGTALSGIVFVGEAPGADEDRKGEPFVGRGGQLLDRIIEGMNEKQLIPGVPLNRDTVFIGNVIHCRPPDNRVPLPFEISQSSPFLRRQLEALAPRIICCLGKTSGEHMLGIKSPLASMRGKVYRLGGAKVVVTYHPAAVLRNPELKRPVWEDMQFLAREYLQD